MTSPVAPATPRGTRLSNVLLVGTTALLIFASLTHMFFVAPMYRRLLVSLNATPSTPTRLAYGISQFGALFFVLGFAGVAWAFWKDRRGNPGLFNVALTIATLAAAIYLCLVSWLYLDVARVMKAVE